MKSEIVEDKRRIVAVWFNDGQETHLTVGGEITGITAYEELGPYCGIPYLRVHDKQGKVSRRLPAWMVEIQYGEEPDDEQRDG